MLAFFHKNINMFTFSRLKKMNLTLLQSENEILRPLPFPQYSHHFCHAYLCARADTASRNQALHPDRSHWKCLSLRDQCNDFCYNVLRLCNAVWSRRFEAGCIVERMWHWYFTHFKLFYFPNIIGLVQRIIYIHIYIYIYVCVCVFWYKLIHFKCFPGYTLF